MKFILVTGEYPPYPGGVADYSASLVEELRRRGHAVRPIVFRTPPATPSGAEFVGSPMRPASYRKLRRAIRESGRESIVLVQYVSWMYGCRGANLFFARSLARIQNVSMWVMFHELFVSVERGARWDHRLIALAMQRMFKTIAGRADRCFASTERYAETIRASARTGVGTEWLPVASNLPSKADSVAVDALRMKLRRDDRTLIGHFGAFGSPHRQFFRALLNFANASPWSFVFIGRGSREFLRELIADGVLPADRGFASGGVAPGEAAQWIAACDIMVQPYEDGACTRRGSLMAPLALGRATVTNVGPITEALWKESGIVALTESADPAEVFRAIATLASDTPAREALESKAAAFHQEHFDWPRIVDRLEAAAGVA